MGLPVSDVPLPGLVPARIESSGGRPVICRDVVTRAALRWPASAAETTSNWKAPRTLGPKVDDLPAQTVGPGRPDWVARGGGPAGRAPGAGARRDPQNPQQRSKRCSTFRSSAAVRGFLGRGGGGRARAGRLRRRRAARGRWFKGPGCPRKTWRCPPRFVFRALPGDGGEMLWQNTFARYGVAAGFEPRWCLPSCFNVGS
jgi:hypothetical protein